MKTVAERKREAIRGIDFRDICVADAGKHYDQGLDMSLLRHSAIVDNVVNEWLDSCSDSYPLAGVHILRNCG